MWQRSASRVSVQMWQRSGEPSPGADVAAVRSHAGTASDRTIEVRATSELFRVITSHFSGVVTMT